MDDEDIVDKVQTENSDELNFSSSPDALDDADVGDAQTKSLGWGWRVVIGIGAVVIVGFLAYPLIQEQQIDKGDSKATVPPEVQAVVAGPEATAEANPDSAESQFELGNSYYEAGQWEPAIAAYKKAIAIDPNYQAAYANLGVTYYQLQQFDLAASQYEKALELNPEDGEVAYNLGALYLQQALSQGEQPNPDLLNQAVAQLQQAMQISPELAEPHFSLGVAYAALNQKAEAIEAFETFLVLDSGQDSRARQEAERYLEILRGQ